MSYDQVLEKPERKPKFLNLKTATDEELENSPNLAIRVELLYLKEKRKSEALKNSIDLEKFRVF